MSKGKVLVGCVLAVSAFGCDSSNSSALGSGTNVGGSAGRTGPATGTGGTSVRDTRPAGGGPSATGIAGTGPVGGSAGTGTGGAGGGTACAGDPLTRCAGTMSGAWCTETVSAGALPSFEGLWANRPDDVWFVGGGQPAPGGTTSAAMAAHFDGCTWTITQVPELPLFTGVWGAASNDVWFVGTTTSNAYHWNGTTMTAAPVAGATTFKSVNGTSSTDVWAVGAGIFHWNGSAWAQSSASVGNDVWAVSPSDVWVASGTTDALHFDGTTWTATALTDFGLFSIWGDATQVYAAGEGESLFRFVGGTWTTLQGRGGSSEGFVDIGGLGADVLTAGNNQVVRLSGNTFTPVTDVPPDSYRSVWVSPTQIWLGTRSGVVTRRAR